MLPRQKTFDNKHAQTHARACIFLFIHIFVCVCVHVYTDTCVYIYNRERERERERERAGASNRGLVFSSKTSGVKEALLSMRILEDELVSPLVRKRGRVSYRATGFPQKVQVLLYIHRWMAFLYMFILILVMLHGTE